MAEETETVKRVSTGFRPHYFQNECLQSLRRFSVVVCHRRFGKTVQSVNLLIHCALKNDQFHPLYAYIAPFRNQAKLLTWNYFRHYTSNIPGVKVNEQELSLTFQHNNATIRLFGADNPEALRGPFYDGVCLDEVAQMKAYLWGEILRPALADRKGWALFQGTPKGQNLFWELYSLAQSEMARLGDDSSWAALSYDINKTLGRIPWLDAEEIELAKRNMSENQFRQEFLCDFSASTDNTLIAIDVVSAACQKKLHPSQYVKQPMILGIDVARYGDDRSVLQRRQGLAAFTPTILHKLDNMQVAALAAREIDTYRCNAVFIDAGRGEGVIDRLRQLGYDCMGINFGGRATDESIYANKRTEMWFKLRDWLEAGGAIADEEELKASLVVPLYSFDGKDRYLLEKKDNMKDRCGFSPDPGDALALTFAAPVHRPEPIELLSGSHRRVETEYDIFAPVAPSRGGRVKTDFDIFAR